MRSRYLFLLLPLLALLSASPAHALSMEGEGDAGTADKTIEDYIKDYVDVPKGAIDWKLFGTTREIKVKDKTPDGYDWYYTKPDFQPPIKALDGQTITIKGFMFPLDDTDDQKNFLFGPFPMSCPFQYHVGPALVLEVHADKNPVKFGYDAVVMTGKLQLVPEDKENNTFYRLLDARQVK